MFQTSSHRGKEWENGMLKNTQLEQSTHKDVNQQHVIAS